MTILNLVTYPDPRLHFRSEPVADIDDETRRQLDDMLETMYDSAGIGLAAVQVGIMKRMLVIDVEQEERGKPVKPIRIINPEIISESDDESSYDEGCLSFPGQYAEVIRPASIKIKYLDENGKNNELEATGLMATCLQHEIDHLNGITFTDHISRLKRDMIHRKLKKQKKTSEV
jgi:peptide deformylase